MHCLSLRTKAILRPGNKAAHDLRRYICVTGKILPLTAQVTGKKLPLMTGKKLPLMTGKKLPLIIIILIILILIYHPRNA